MYHHVFVAGTFDGLHAGHQEFLARAFAEGEKVTIGLTSDAFVKKFKVQSIKCKVNSHEERRAQLVVWLEQQDFLARATIIAIDDPDEPAASMPDLDALVVTSETRKRGERINELRMGSTPLPLSSLTLIEIPMVEAQDGVPISSTRLRNGEIDADGRLVMPESLRAILAQPLGTVLKKIDIAASITRSLELVTITVGDIATKTLLDAGVIPNLAIIDGRVGREPFSEVIDRLKPASSIKSGPGFISKEAVKAIESTHDTGNQAIKQHHVILIDGEEDLLLLPAVIHAPLGAIVYYGQPNEGLVEVVVTKEKKREALELIQKFT